MRKHLIHIGYPKTGSTFLQEWFNQNPQISHCQWGLAGFYDVSGVVRMAAAQPQVDFTCFVTSSEDISTPRSDAGDIPIHRRVSNPSEPSTIYESQRKCCEILKDLFPTSKILLVTRGFRKKMFSGFSQGVKQGRIITFEQKFLDPTSWINEGLQRLYDLYEINHLVEMYVKAFGKENVIVLPYELLQDDRRRFLSIIENEMGLQPFDGEIPRLNESLSPEELYWYPYFSKVVYRFARLFAQKRDEKIYRWYVTRAMENKFSWLVKILNKLKPGRRVVAEDLPEEIFENCEGFATVLKDNPLYQPYLAAYRLD